jgi:hypothetical protein
MQRQHPRKRIDAIDARLDLSVGIRGVARGRDWLDREHELDAITSHDRRSVPQRHPDTSATRNPHTTAKLALERQ